MCVYTWGGGGGVKNRFIFFLKLYGPVTVGGGRGGAYKFCTIQRPSVTTSHRQPHPISDCLSKTPIKVLQLKPLVNNNLLKVPAATFRG